ncbi:MAG: IS30 family transposase [Defluviitaleaceae bacterium]|nr:IS30 family transposase [Defluviitaleaceae bacterium]
MGRENHTTPQRKREHLNIEERKTIERMLRAGANKEKIASALYRDKSTIKREIKRGSVDQRKRNPYESKDPAKEYITTTVYFADAGQRVYEQRRSNSGSKNKTATCREMVSFVETKVLGPEKWSPDAAIGYAKAIGLYTGSTFCTKTFYNWVEDGLVKVKNIDLLLKVLRKPRSARKQRKKVLGKCIDERPAAVEAREEFGHWEGDGIVGKRRKGHLITLVERKIGIGFLFDAGSRDGRRIVEIIDTLERQYGSDFPNIFKTITFDNGAEFSESAAMERNGRTEVYYAHPYSSFERGTNENWNGIVRRFIPKGSSFEKLDENDIRRINHYINTLPRKRFGYKTPLDLWHEQMNMILSA